MWSVNDLFISTGSHSFCPVGMDSNYDQIFLQNPVGKEVEVEAVKSEQEPQNDNLFNWPQQNPTMQTTPTFAPSYASYPYMQQMYYSYANYPFSTTTTPWTQQGYTAPLVQTPPLSPSSPSLREKEVMEPKASPMRVTEKKAKRQTNTIHAMCKLCQKEEFNTGHMSMIMSHLAFHDKSLSRYACTVCGMAFTRRDKVKEHIASKCEGGKLEIKQDDQYKSKLRRWAAQCFPESLVERIMDQCAKEAEKFLRLNKEQPVNNNMIKCRKCDKEVQNSPGSRSHHAKTHSEMKQYECSSCGHQGHMKDNLKVHSIKRHQRLVPIKDLFNNQMMEEYARLHEECFPPEDRKNASKQTTVDQTGDFDVGQYPLSTIQPTTAYGFPSPATSMNPAFPSVSWPSMTMPTMLWSGFQQMNTQSQLSSYEQS